MRSALYYPHTEIQSPGLMKTALMLWDNIQVIVPFEGYKPKYKSKELRKSFELIGECHSPTEEEKHQAHALVEDFATKKLPDAFAYGSVESVDKAYQVYPQKLLPETWNLLNNLGLAGKPLVNHDYPTAHATGLTLLSLLADCCAGESLVRVTDRSSAYASLAGLLTKSASGPETTARSREELLALTLQVADADAIPLSKWIALREREQAAADGHFVRELRHRFVQHLETQASKIVSAKTGADAREAKRQFQDDIKDDYRALREALKLDATQVLPGKDVMIYVLGGLLAAGALALGQAVPMPDVITPIGAAATIGGLVATRSKYVNARRKILREHPISYLYEASGGLRI